MIIMMFLMFFALGGMMTLFGTIVPEYGFMISIMGLMMQFVGVFVLWTRMAKTGARHIVDSAHPEKLLWFYMKKNGNMEIIPAFVGKEGTTTNSDESMIINDMKSYRLADHQVRFIPEDLGICGDHRLALYIKRVKKRFGYEDIRQAREDILVEERLAYPSEEVEE